MPVLVLVRHAETAMAGRFCGHADPPLCAVGKAQLPAIAHALSRWKIERVISSDLARARQTAEPLAAFFGVPLACRAGLRELSFGAWEGLNWSEIIASDAKAAAQWAAEFPHRTAPDGEAYAQFILRVGKEARWLLSQAAMRPVAVVTHAGFMREMLQQVCGVNVEDSWEWTRAYGASIVVNEIGEIIHVSAEDAAESLNET